MAYYKNKKEEKRRNRCMSKKIVVITGSPRKNGNSFAMTEAFIKAAEGKGHTVRNLLFHREGLYF